VDQSAVAEPLPEIVDIDIFGIGLGMEIEELPTRPVAPPINLDQLIELWQYGNSFTSATALSKQSTEQADVREETLKEDEAPEHEDCRQAEDKPADSEWAWSSAPGHWELLSCHSSVSSLSSPYCGDEKMCSSWASIETSTPTEDSSEEGEWIVKELMPVMAWDPVCCCEHSQECGCGNCNWLAEWVNVEDGVEEGKVKQS